MPVYQYACTECGDRLEVRQSFTDPALTECPACEGRLRKVLNAVGVVFKGSGFYRNDSRAAAKAEGGSGKNGDTSGSESSSKKSPTPTTGAGGSDSKGSSDKSSGVTPAAASRS